MNNLYSNHLDSTTPFRDFVKDIEERYKKFNTYCKLVGKRPSLEQYVAYAKRKNKCRQ